MFTRVLVPLDGTPAAEGVIPTARALAHATGAEIVLLRVLSVWHHRHDDPEVIGAREYLSRFADDLTGDGIRAVTVVIGAISRVEDLPAAIVAEARTRRADLLLMTTRGRGGLARAILGSAAEGVLAHSPIPVMLLRPGGRRLARIGTLVVPVDGSPGGQVALDVAAKLARRTSARIILVQVASPASRRDQAPIEDISADGGVLCGDQRDDAYMAAYHFVTGQAGKLVETGVATEGRVTRGPVAESIVKRADDVGADLIVMSTHARTGPKRAILGSVADAVVRAANVPVLLVRQTG
jgi:nucleotide-binding universal stress UspA family protein